MNRKGGRTCIVTQTKTVKALIRYMTFFVNSDTNSENKTKETNNWYYLQPAQINCARFYFLPKLLTLNRRSIFQHA